LSQIFSTEHSNHYSANLYIDSSNTLQAAQATADIATCGQSTPQPTMRPCNMGLQSHLFQVAMSTEDLRSTANKNIDDLGFCCLEGNDLGGCCSNGGKTTSPTTSKSTQPGRRNVVGS
jgi:hypothetical protein